MKTSPQVLARISATPDPRGHDRRIVQLDFLLAEDRVGASLSAAAPEMALALLTMLGLADEAAWRADGGEAKARAALKKAGVLA